MNGFLKNVVWFIVSRVIIFVLLVLRVFVFGWSYLVIRNTRSLKLACKIKKAYPELSTYGIGGLSLAAMYKAYDSRLTLESFDFTTEEKEQIQAMLAISDVLHRNIPNVKKSKSGGVTGAYLGPKSERDDDGLYVLEFKNPISIDQSLIDTAHQINLQYYFIQGKYVVIVNAEFMESNNLTIEDFSSKLASIV